MNFLSCVYLLYSNAQEACLNDHLSWIFQLFSSHANTFPRIFMAVYNISFIIILSVQCSYILLHLCNASFLGYLWVLCWILHSNEIHILSFVLLFGEVMLPSVLEKEVFMKRYNVTVFLFTTLFEEIPFCVRRLVNLNDKKYDSVSESTNVCHEIWIRLFSFSLKGY